MLYAFHDGAMSLPGKPRYYLPGIPAHVVQRGNCRQAVFYADEDYKRYLDWLIEGASRHGCQIHAYVLMTPDSSDSISRVIQFVGRHYVTYVNRTYHKSGALWEGRHKGWPMTITFLPVCVTLSSIRCAPGWLSIRQPMTGPAIAIMRQVHR